MVATNVQTLDRSPKTTAARQRTREDIYDLVERASKSAEAALTRSDEHVATTVRLEGKIDLVVKALGSESLDEYGAKVIENRQRGQKHFQRDGHSFTEQRKHAQGECNISRRRKTTSRSGSPVGGGGNDFHSAGVFGCVPHRLLSLKS